jgi:ribulose bisphosphate carboxylase small subunit
MANDTDLGFDIEEEDEFDPFAEGDFVEEDDGTIEEVPELTELPEEVRKHGAYDVSRYGSAEEATEALLKKNPGRKPVFLGIIEYCCDTRTASEVDAFVEKAQASNFSVYNGATLCRMLKTSGALEFTPAVTAEAASEENGVEYLEIVEEKEATWTATDAGLAVVAAHREGNDLRELLAKEAQYEPIYRRLFAFCYEQPRKKPEIDELINHDPLVQKPRRFASHFVELLESREAMAWVDGHWTLTDLGRSFWEQIKDDGATQE